MTPSSAVRDEAACRSAANRSLLVSPRLLNFRVCGSHTRRGQADCRLPRRGRILLWKGNQTCFGEGVRNLSGLEVFRDELASAGRQQRFQLGVTANRRFNQGWRKSNAKGALRFTIGRACWHSLQIGEDATREAKGGYKGGKFSLRG